MKLRPFVRHRLLGISDRPLEEWKDADYAHYTILCACLVIAGIVGAGGAVYRDRPPLLAVAMIATAVMIFQLVFSLLAWRMYRASVKRPPPRP